MAVVLWNDRYRGCDGSVVLWNDRCRGCNGSCVVE